MMILVLRPQKRFGIVAAELRQVASLSQYMMVERAVRSEGLRPGGQDRGALSTGTSADPGHEQLYQLATLCEELLPASLYVKYANKKVFRHEKDFWETTESLVRTHVKRMADMRLIKAVRLSDSLDIPILYAPTEKSPLHISERLLLEDGKDVTPVMNFHRHGDGVSYQLQLRIGGELIENPSAHNLTVLAFEPGMFLLDGRIYLLDSNFSAKLLLPFVQKAQVEIPQKMENDYFRRFIMKHVTRAEINAEGFDIADISEQPRPCLNLETNVSGHWLLTLCFKYGNTEYAPDTKVNGRVMLTDDNGHFRFIRWLRKKSLEEEQMELLRQITAGKLTAGGEVWFPSLAVAIDWLRQHGPELKTKGFDVVQPSDNVYYIGPLSVEQNDTWHGDWLQTNVTVVIDNGRLRIPFQDLRETILRGEQEYMLPSGERLLIPHEWLQRYSDLLLIGLPKENGFQRHRSQLGDLAPGPSPLADVDGHTQGQYQGDADETPVSPWTGAGNVPVVLRPYQVVGFRWLWINFKAQTGCCLSDEMGLGKTLQTIALLLKYKEVAKTARTARHPRPGMLFSDEEMQGGGAPSQQAVHICEYKTSLVVAPASVVHNWRNELERFAPSLQVLDYTGDAAKRQDRRKTLMHWDVVLTSYRTLHNDIEHIAHLQFGIVVFDESQAFKTHTSQIHHTVAQIKAFHRMALSGTPVENNLGELWSLMNVLNPHLLGDIGSFQKSFVNPIAVQMEESRRDLLRRLIAPYFLRRTKEEVLKDLPERQDEVVVCPMTERQVSSYAEELSKARNEWLDNTVSLPARQMTMLAALQRLRHIANGEGKLTVVFEQLEILRQTSHKVLIFSEYVTLLEHVGSKMQDRGWKYALLTGKTREREEVIARFQREPDCQFFLISLKAGGVGLNLTAADYVFLLDPWWNRAAEEQAIARAHRLGQQRAVFVYRFVSAGTLEEQILTLQERKQTLIDSVMPFICQQ